MRLALVAGAALVLASCTLLVSIDDDVSAGRPDAAIPERPEAGPSLVPNDGDAPREGGTAEAGITRPGCPGPPDDPSLIGWFPLDETEGTIAHDCSPSGKDVHSFGAVDPKWVAGKIAGGADFAGEQTCFTAADKDAFAFDNGQPFTVAAWVFLRAFDEANLTGRWIASHKASPYGWHLGADDPDRLEIDFEYGAGQKTQVSAVGTLGKWLHVTATYKPGEGTTYLDGVLTERVTGPKIPAGFATTSDIGFHIGCRVVTTNVFDGVIDDVRLYSRILSEPEITALAARGR